LDNEQLIKQISEQIIKDNGEQYGVTVGLEKVDFPTKQYGDVVLPAGEYEALRVVIGDGLGKNWWCVMFPPLCFVDITHGTVPDETKKELQKVLTEDEYNIVVSAKTEEVIPVKVKFKIVELWQENKEIKTIFAKLNGIGE
jgi:stage II sporulation protein R